MSEISSHSFLTIDSEEPITEAVNILGRNDLSQLVISDCGVLWGIITPADLVRVLEPHRRT